MEVLDQIICAVSETFPFVRFEMVDDEYRTLKIFADDSGDHYSLEVRGEDKEDIVVIYTAPPHTIKTTWALNKGKNREEEVKVIIDILLLGLLRNKTILGKIRTTYGSP
nr:hypothetical protein K-LCC10_0145 [Kaumoebavirus]